MKPLDPVLLLLTLASLVCAKNHRLNSNSGNKLLRQRHTNTHDKGAPVPVNEAFNAQILTAEPSPLPPSVQPPPPIYDSMYNDNALFEVEGVNVVSHAGHLLLIT